jgi:predicted nucleic acid-binding protein
MVYKVFLDTNIIIDFLQPVRPFHDEAQMLFMHLTKDSFIAYISESVITTTSYLIRKEYSANEINAIIKNLNLKLKILSCTNAFVIAALQQNPPDFEDALLYQVALHHQMDYFVTSNVKGFKKIQQPLLPVIRARELNKLLSE